MITSEELKREVINNLPKVTGPVSGGVYPGSLNEWLGPSALSASAIPPAPLKDSWGEGHQGRQEHLSLHTFLSIPGRLLLAHPEQNACPPPSVSLCTWSPPCLPTDPPPQPLLSPALLCSHLSWYSPNLNPVHPPLQAPCPSPKDSHPRRGK